MSCFGFALLPSSMRRGDVGQKERTLESSHYGLSETFFFCVEYFSSAVKNKAKFAKFFGSLEFISFNRGYCYVDLKCQQNKNNCRYCFTCYRSHLSPLFWYTSSSYLTVVNWFSISQPNDSSSELSRNMAVTHRWAQSEDNLLSDHSLVPTRPALNPLLTGNLNSFLRMKFFSLLLNIDHLVGGGRFQSHIQQRWAPGPAQGPAGGGCRWSTFLLCTGS